MVAVHNNVNSNSGGDDDDSYLLLRITVLKLDTVLQMCLTLHFFNPVIPILQMRLWKPKERI